MRFVNREAELEALERLAQRSPAMAVLVGRRRIGKTALLRQFLEAHEGCYLYVDGGKSSAALLEEFTAKLTAYLKLGRYARFDDWEGLLEALFEAGRSRQVLVAIDEFQRFMEVAPTLIYQLQQFWDTRREGCNLTLLLAGSALGMMKRVFEAGGAPLFKRAQNLLRVSPLDFAAVRQLLRESQITNFEAQVTFYALFGGLPFYYSLVNHYGCRNLQEALERLLLSPFAPLLNEARDLMVESFGKQHRTYFSLLAGLGGGRTTKKELADWVDVKQTSLSPYLTELIEHTGLVEYRPPVTVARPERSKLGRYRLADPLLSFYFRHLYPHRSLIELGQFEPLRVKVADQLKAYTGLHFEALCAETLLKLAQRGELPFTLEKLGGWWNRKGEEVDLVGLGTTPQGRPALLLAECKWRSRPVGLNRLESLQAKTGLVEGQAAAAAKAADSIVASTAAAADTTASAAAPTLKSARWQTYYALFSKAGFTAKLKALAAADPRLLLYELAELERVWS